jgi:hypothetical protein
MDDNSLLYGKIPPSSGAKTGGKNNTLIFIADFFSEKDSFSREKVLTSHRFAPGVVKMITG